MCSHVTILDMKNIDLCTTTFHIVPKIHYHPINLMKLCSTLFQFIQFASYTHKPKYNIAKTHFSSLTHPKLNAIMLILFNRKILYALWVDEIYFSANLTWTEYMIILKHFTAKSFGTQRLWLSKCLKKKKNKRVVNSNF